MPRLLDLMLHNGTGSWFSRCHGCQATSPTVPDRDELGVLAAAKKESWRCDRQRDGRHVLVCPACVVRRRPEPVVMGC